MQHVESSIKVFWSKDYSLFRMINGNRELNALKIKKITGDIAEGIDVLRFCPILVRENRGVLDIIDGQHRFYVSRKIKSNVWYIVAKDMSLYEIAKINSNTEKWKPKDFINCYVQTGNENYTKLRNVLDNYAVTVSDAASLLSTGTVRGGGTRGTFEQGKLQVKHEDYCLKLLDTVSKFDFNGKYSRNFLLAIDKVIQGEKVSVDELISKVNQNSTDLLRQANYKDYLLNLESIYNKGKQSRKVIY